jgi:uncharacterized protein YndB with AHSA1/START domain
MRQPTAGLAALLALVPAISGAEVRASTPDSMLIEHRFAMPLPPDRAWDVLVHPERYWPDEHTWSGKASNMSLVPEAGGCFCERWQGGSAEHGRIIMAQPGVLLRFRGSLGPFQDMAVSGVLTVKLSPVEGGTEATVTYRLSGDASHGLDAAAPVVDKVIGLQFGNFAALAAQQAH